MARSPHKTAHPKCPHANWAACDTAQKVAFGQCRALVDGKPEPHPCSRWAISEDGWCGQHYASEKEAEKRASRIAIAREEMLGRIDSFIERIAADPSHSWMTALVPSVESTRGLAGVPGVEPGTAVLETAPPPRLTPVLKRPHRISAATV